MCSLVAMSSLSAYVAVEFDEFVESSESVEASMIDDGKEINYYFINK